MGTDDDCCEQIPVAEAEKAGLCFREIKVDLYVGQCPEDACGEPMMQGM